MWTVGDGTGVGKGRELAAIVWDNWLRAAGAGGVPSQRRACWFTCNTDLAVDARRDLDDIGASDLPLKNLTACGYGDLAVDYGFTEGVLLVTCSQPPRPQPCTWRTHPPASASPLRSAPPRRLCLSSVVANHAVFASRRVCGQTRASSPRAAR